MNKKGEEAMEGGKEKQKQMEKREDQEDGREKRKEKGGSQSKILPWLSSAFFLRISAAVVLVTG